MFFGKMRPIKGKGDTGQVGEGVTGDVTITIDSSEDVVPISPYIYGGNQDFEDFPATFHRYSGNMYSAYNWVDGHLNFGTDYNNWNTNRPSGGAAYPGEWVETLVQEAFDDESAAMVTIQMCDYVAADGVNTEAIQATDPSRFHNTAPAKGSAFSLTPNTSGGVVYQDEFVNWLMRTFEATPDQNDTLYPIFYTLDNEPALWSSTHANIHPSIPDYAEVVDKGVAYSAAIKAVHAEGKVVGAALWGWPAFDTLQYHSDFDTYGDFTEYYLSEMNTASVSAGIRLLDYLDFHWYTHAQRSGTAIPTPAEWVRSIVNPIPSQYDAILQSPRSLWDPTYTELSWVANEAGSPIQLIPRMRERIANNYPGTGMSLTEYNYGSNGHIMGGLVQADVLGVFGKEQIDIATIFGTDADYSYTYAAFTLYRDFDGEGKQFGDTSIQVDSDDIESASIYAAVDDGDATRMTVVAINKTDAALSVGVNVTHGTTMLYGQSYILDDQASTIEPSVTIDDLSVNTFTYSMPAYSASMIELSTTDNHYVPPVPPEPPSYDPPEPMLVISRSVPAYWTTSGGSGAITAVNDASYGTFQFLSVPVGVVYDLSGVSAANRANVLLHWNNSEYQYQNGDRALSAYTVDAHTDAGGGSPPSHDDSGWVTLLTEPGPNYENGGQFEADMSGDDYNWIRLNITAVTGGVSSVHMNLDVHDASLGAEDCWFFSGDSVTAGAMILTENNGSDTGSPDHEDDNFPQIIFDGTGGTHFPSQQNAGVGGTTSTNGASNMSGWLATFPGLYVPISFGTNDVNGGMPAQTFYNNYESMVQTVIAAGKIPIIPTVMWIDDGNPTHEAALIEFNSQLATLKTNYTEILDGPDLYTFFMNNTQYMTDSFHPTNEGRCIYRRMWAEKMLEVVYGL